MGLLNRFINYFNPNSSIYNSNTVIKVKTKNYTFYRHKIIKTKNQEIIQNISFLIAFICLFEAGVWFTTGYPEQSLTNLRINYLKNRILNHTYTLYQFGFELSNKIRDKYIKYNRLILKRIKEFLNNYLNNNTKQNKLDINNKLYLIKLQQNTLYLFGLLISIYINQCIKLSNKEYQLNQIIYMATMVL